jgi:hypothetical protein
MLVLGHAYTEQAIRIWERMIYSGLSIGHLRTSNLDIRDYRLSIA